MGKWQEKGNTEKDGGLGVATLDFDVRRMDHHCIVSLRKIGFWGAGW